MTVTENNPGTKSATTGGRRRSVLVFIPLIVFLGLAAVFLIRLGAGDISVIPSALIGRPAPATVLPAVAGLERNG
jgi:cytochrome c biogenesis protein CcmG, thiol:disulfide interchange protein DsbE